MLLMCVGSVELVAVRARRERERERKRGRERERERKRDARGPRGVSTLLL